MNESFTTQLNYAIETLLSPAGGFALLAGLVLLISLFFSPRIKWYVLTAAFWVVGLAFFLRPGQLPIRMAFPLEQIRSNGRSISTGLILILLIPAIISPAGWRMRRAGIPLMLFFFFELMMTARMLLAGVSDRGVLSLIIYPLVFLSLGWGLSKWIQSMDDAHRLLRAVMFAAAIFVVGSAFQFAVNRAAVLNSGRFQGTTGNPQHASMLIAVALPISLYLVSRAAEPKFMRVIAGVVSGFLVIFLLWTGSRTGLLMAGTSIAFTFRSRMGRFVLVSIFAGIFVLLALQIYDEATTTVVGMFDRGDTRTRVWAAMWAEFLEHPAMGAMQGDFGVGENSYLSAAGAMGLFGLIPLMAFVVVTGLTCLKVTWSRRLLGSERPLADAVTGGLAAIFVGGMFEAHLLGTLTFSIFCVYAFGVLLAFMQDVIDAERRQRQLAAEAGEMHEYEYDDMLPSGPLQPQPFAEQFG